MQVSPAKYTNTGTFCCPAFEGRNKLNWDVVPPNAADCVEVRHIRVINGYMRSDDIISVQIIQRKHQKAL